MKSRERSRGNEVEGKKSRERSRGKEVEGKKSRENSRGKIVERSTNWRMPLVQIKS